MHKSLRGELTMKADKTKFSLENNGFITKIAEALKVETVEGMKEINDTVTPVLINSVVATVSKQF